MSTGILSEKSRAILEMIANGYSYQHILEAHSGLSYIDIFRAAAEALEVIERDGKASAKVPNEDRYADIRKKHPRAYEKWTPEEDERLIQMLREGVPLNVISQALQRQRGAITSRINKQQFANHIPSHSALESEWTRESERLNRR